MPSLSPLALVLEWQDAANQQDSDRLAELSTPDIEVVGPRGSGHGRQLLREWLARAGLHLTTVRAFARDDRDDVVVLAQRGVWRSVETGAATGERDLASRFRVDGQQVAQFARYDSLDLALAEAGLQEADELPLST